MAILGYISAKSYSALEIAMGPYCALGLNGAIGSPDVVHIPWGRCAKNLKTLHTGKEGYPTIAYNCTGLHDGSFSFCTPGSYGSCNNDRNMIWVEWPSLDTFQPWTMMWKNVESCALLIRILMIIQLYHSNKILCLIFEGRPKLSVLMILPDDQRHREWKHYTATSECLSWAFWKW